MQKNKYYMSIDGTIRNQYEKAYEEVMKHPSMDNWQHYREAFDNLPLSHIFEREKFGQEENIYWNSIQKEFCDVANYIVKCLPKDQWGVDTYLVFESAGILRNLKGIEKIK